MSVLKLTFCLLSLAIVPLFGDQTGTVVAASLNLRLSPSTSAPVLGELKKGASVTILEQVGEWYRVFPSQGLRGCLPASSFQNGVLRGAAAFRTAPKSPDCGFINAASSFTVLETRDGWTHILLRSAGGLKLFAHANYIRATAAATPAPAAKSASAVGGAPVPPPKATANAPVPPPKAAANAPVQGIKPHYGILIYDVRNHREIWSQNADRQRSIASLTKMMTLLLALEKLKADPAITLESMVPVSAEAAAEPPTKACLIAGQSVKLRELLSVMIVTSCNDCAAAAGEFIGGSKAGFCRLANEKAQKLGLAHAKFFNANGLPGATAAQDNTGTPRDMLILARELWKHPQAREWVKMPSAPITTGVAKPTTIKGHTPLLGKYGVDGIKTGYTRRAGSCVATHAQTAAGEYIIVILGCESAGTRNTLLESIMKYLAAHPRGA